MIRPSNRELHKKIEEAKASLKGQSGLFAHPAKAVGELEALGIGDTGEVWGLIQEFLEEIEPADYAGVHPPLRSYEKSIKECELFAFSWWSKKVEKRMYIKFALKNERYYYVSLHEDKKKVI